jgi:hypothetical protein
MVELQDRLEGLAAAYQQAARPPGPSSARRRGRQRRRRQAGVAGLLTMALVTAGIVASSGLLTEPRPSTVAPATSSPGSDPALAWIPPAREREMGGVDRTGPIVLVTQGVANGSTWKLATYPSGERICSVVVRDGKDSEYACGLGVPGQRPVMSSWSTSRAAAPSPAFVHGQVVEQAARVRIEFPGHRPIELQALQAPTDAGVRFFAASIQMPRPRPRSTAVIALDEHGTELGRQDIRWATAP